MILRKLPNASASKITVTSSSQDLSTLIDTANGGPANLDPTIDALIIHVEDGDINLGYNYTPTASLGFLLKEGNTYYFNKVYFASMNLIRTGASDVSCRIQIGESEKQEQTVFGQMIGSGGGGSSTASGSAGGDMSQYVAKPSGLNADATVAYTSPTTITITGLPFTFTKYDIESIRQIPNAGGAGDQDTLYTDVADFSVSGGVITVAGASFATTDNFIVKLLGLPKTINSSNDSQSVEIINPESENYDDVITIFNALSADTTQNIDVSNAKSVKLIGVSSDTADLHASIDIKVSYDGGSNFYDLPGQAVSFTRNMNYTWWINVASITHIQFNLDEITATAGTLTLYMMKSFQDAPTPELPPIAYTLRESAVLTASYVSGKEVFIEGFEHLAVIAEFTTGASGATNEWSPNYQIEVSRTRTGDNWAYLNRETYSSPEVSLARTVINHAATPPAYTSASTPFKDVIAELQNKGYKRIRVSVKDESTPTNAGSMALYLVAR